jgi:hypothetical protein
MRHPKTILTALLAVLSLAACAPGGTLLRLHLPVPLEPGPHRLRLELPVGMNPAALTADLVSPSMPMHGIVRVALEVEDGSAGAVVPLDIPMEGEWALYVNVDGIGADAAEFLFDVAPGPDGPTHNHDTE